MTLLNGEQQMKLLGNDRFAEPAAGLIGTNELPLRIVSNPDSSIRISRGLTSDGAASSCLRIEEDENAFSEEPVLRDAIPPLFLAIKTGDICNMTNILNQDPKLVNNPKYSGFPPIHYACKYGSIGALRTLLQHGANVGAYDAFGNTALHLAVYDSWHEGVAELLSHGASPDARNEPPSVVKEVKSDTALHAALRIEDMTSVSLILKHGPDLEELDSDGSTVLHLAAHTCNLALINTLLKENVCREMLGEKDCHGNSIFHAVLLNECPLENEMICIEIYRNFINVGASIYLDDVNNQGESPLFMAAYLKLPKLVEFLLSLKVDTAQVTNLGQTVIHAACYSGCATCLSHLLNTGLLYSQVTQADKKDKVPFHYAVQTFSIDCCELLLKNGDHLTHKDSDGISRFSLILKHLPSATQLLLRLFDAHIKLSNKPYHDPDFHIIFDYSGLLSEDKKICQSSITSEFNTSHLEPLLKHPLLESFLYLKWQRIKTLFYSSVFIYFIYLMIHTIFIILTFGDTQLNVLNQAQLFTTFVFLHIIVMIFIIVPDSIILFANIKKYLWQIETYTKAIAMISSAVLLFCCSVPTHTYLINGYHYLSGSAMTNSSISEEGNHNESSTNISFINLDEPYDIRKVKLVRYSAAISSFFGWVEFMMLLGRFPIFGAYVLMFTRVAKSIIKFLVAFSSLLIGFALCFMVLMNENQVFRNFPLSLIKTLMMMNGEIEYSDLYGNMQMPVISLIAVASFVFLVCIIMANLLIALAVSDIPDIQRQGKIRRLAKQAAYLVSYDKLISVAHNSRYFPKCLRKIMSNQSSISRKVSIYPNMNSKEQKLKRSLPHETIQEAILRGRSYDAKHDLSNLEEEEEDMKDPFNSFRLKYNKDRKLLHENLTNIPKGVITEKRFKEHLDQLQKTMEKKLTQLTLQMSEQMQQNQSLMKILQSQTQHSQTLVHRNISLQSNVQQNTNGMH